MKFNLKHYIQVVIKKVQEELDHLKQFFIRSKERIIKKRKEFLTVMVIPHNEKPSYKISITYKAITIFFLIVSSIVGASAIVVLGYSGRVHEMEELEISSGDFQRQSLKLKSEMNLLHEISSYYYQRVSRLYIKLGGDPSKVGRTDKSKLPLGVFDTKTDIIPETYTLKSDTYYLKKSAELTKEIIKTIKQRKSIIKNTPSLWPTRGYILFPFGKYFSPITGREVINNGIDIGTFPGTEVIATAPGEIYETGYTESTGYFIKIVHKYGWKTIYSNLERLQVKKGEMVSKGDILGYVGKISGSSIFHLHYEVHVGTNPLNPYSFLNQVQN